MATRATLWRQKADPLLTLDDAQSWLRQSGLCLFLPRKAQIPAPAPTFVEACLGETNPTPPRAAIETAKTLLVRLIEANSALPLNLLGAPTDHPDFLVSVEALPFVYALRGDRDWKHAPGTASANRVSPLVTQVWKLLEARGVLTATEIQGELGRELTEAAVLRALHELWSSLRVVPLYQPAGQETLWEPLQSRHQKAMTSGVGMSQVTALSVLVSVYLQSVVAASGDDAESFLSPLASRSKVREVVRGLTATRQVSLIQMETHSLLYVEGSLPEFAEEEKVVEIAADSAKPIRRAHPTSPEGLAAALARKTAGTVPRPAYKRPAAANDAQSADRRAVRPAGRPPLRSGIGSFRPAAASSRPAFRSKAAPIERSEPGTGLRADGTPKKTRWRDLPGGRPDQKGKPARFGPRKIEAAGAGPEARPAAPRREAGSFRPAASAEPAFRPSGGSRPPFKSSGQPREGKPYRPTGTGRPATGRASGGFRPAAGSSRLERPAYGGSGRPSSRPAAAGGRPAYRTSGAQSAGGSRPPARSGDGRFAARPEGSRPFFRPRREDSASAARAPREAREGGDRKFTPRPPRAGGFSSARPRPGDSRPYTPRAGSSPGSGRPAYGGPSGGRPVSAGSAPYRGSSSQGSSSGRPGRPPSGRTFSGKPGGGRLFGGSSSGRAAGKGGPGFKPDYKPRSKPSSGQGTGGRPGFGQGPRPGAGRKGPASTSRPTAKFKKRPEPSE